MKIYATGKNDPLYIKEMALLNADPQGIRERDILIKTHFNHATFRVTLTGKEDGKNTALLIYWGCENCTV